LAVKARQGNIMGIIRVLICILLPPLAVLDKGCGSFLLVFVLTMLGWIPGILAALIICSQAPRDGRSARSSYTVRLSRRQWRRLLSKAPQIGPYELTATKRQLAYLWKLGLRDESVLDKLGRDQASRLIDSAKRTSTGLSLGAVILVVGLVVAVGYSVARVSSSRGNSTAPPEGFPRPRATPKPVSVVAPAPRNDTQPATSTPKPAFDVEAAKRRAVTAYPQLGVANSPLNREFVRRYQEYQQTRPDYFDDPEWPTKLANESFDAIKE
jgi:uncharacterized membrane protein YqaE (UPF0057 family)